MPLAGFGISSAPAGPLCRTTGACCWNASSGLTFYAGLCGWTLARAHAQSGVPVAVAAYLEVTDAFDRSVTELAQLYADRNERDHEPFATAVRPGRLEALEGV